MNTEKTTRESKSKSVVYIIDNFIYGGVTTFVKQYCEMAHSLGYTCTIIGFMGDMRNPTREFPHAQLIIIPKFMQHGSILNRLIDGYHYIRALNKFYKTHHVDVVHLATTWSSLFAAMLMKTWQAHRVYTFYGAYHSEYFSMAMHKKTLVSQIKMLFMKLFQTISLNISTDIITFSHYADSLLRKTFLLNSTIKIHVIPGSVSIKKETKHLTSTIGTLSVIWVGRAEPRKGLIPLLHAIKLANSDQHRINLTIASPVEYYRNYFLLEELERLNLGLAVRLLHKADNALLDELFSQADVFIMPSQELETFGMTLIESLARGIPVIGTPVGAIPEILIKIDKHLITKSTSPKSIYESLMWFRKLPPKQRMELSKKSIAYVRAYHAPLQYTSTLESAYTR